MYIMVALLHDVQFDFVAIKHEAIKISVKYLAMIEQQKAFSK